MTTTRYIQLVTALPAGGGVVGEAYECVSASSAAHATPTVVWQLAQSGHHGLDGTRPWEVTDHQLYACVQELGGGWINLPYNLHAKRSHVRGGISKFWDWCCHFNISYNKEVKLWLYLHLIILNIIPQFHLDISSCDEIVVTMVTEAHDHRSSCKISRYEYKTYE